MLKLSILLLLFYPKSGISWLFDCLIYPGSGRVMPYIEDTTSTGLLEVLRLLPVSILVSY